MKINEITINPQMSIPGDPLRFRVGHPAVADGHVIDKINYHPSSRIFNKGLEFGRACYAIYFADIPERRIICEEAVISAEVVKETKQPENAEASVGLPE